MITLASGNTVQGKAGTATAVTYTILGMELSGGTEAYRVLSQGQLATSATAIYTATSVTAFVKMIFLTNTTGSDVSGIALYVNGTAASNEILD